MRDITSSLVANLAGSSQVAPTFWLNPQNGVQYPVIQTPQYRLDTLAALADLPVGGGDGNSQVLGAVANFTRTRGNTLVSQYDIQPLVQIHATTQGRDLGAVAVELRRILADTASNVPKGSTVSLLRPGTHDGERIFGFIVRPAWGNCAYLPTDCSELSIVGRSVRHYYRIAGSACRHRLDAVRDTHADLCAGANRRDHVHGCGNRE